MSLYVKNLRFFWILQDSKRHDWDIFKQNPPDLPKGILPWIDAGYNRIQNDFTGLKNRWYLSRGHGARRRRNSTPAKSTSTRKLSKARAVVEHTFLGVEEFKIFGAGISQGVVPAWFDNRHRIWIGQLPDIGEQKVCNQNSGRTRRSAEASSIRVLSGKRPFEEFLF
jgi:hypothetical protein